MEIEGEVIEHQEIPQVDNAIEEVVTEETQEPNEPTEKMVPLSVLQKERNRRKEAEMNVEYHRQLLEKNKNHEPEDDSYKYESATKEDLMRSQQEAIRAVEEKRWMKENPEKVKILDEELKTFLKQKPNLIAAIESAENRYEEAYELMTAFTKREKPKAKAKPADVIAPHSPASIPKISSMNAKVDVMSMSDKEFQEWRNGLKKRRRAY